MNCYREIVKNKIETHLNILIGQPLIISNRASNMQMFGFGKWVVATRGESRKVGEYALHLQCAWRIVSSNEILVGSSDMYYPNGNPDVEQEDWDWDVVGKNRCDEQINFFLEQQVGNQLILKNIIADEVGSLTLLFKKDIKLEVFPNNSLSDEHWRFFKSGTDESHFVFSGNGIEIE